MPGLSLHPSVPAAPAAGAVREEVQRRWQHLGGSEERWEALVEAVEEEAGVSVPGQAGRVPAWLPSWQAQHATGAVAGLHQLA